VSDIPDDILDIQETDPLKIILAIDKQIRPKNTDINNYGDIEAIRKYHSTMAHACRLFGVDFNVDDPVDDGTDTARQLLYATKATIDKKKIDLLHDKLKRETNVVLDASWRDKIHSYLTIIRQIVERAEMHVAIRERILGRLSDLAIEVDRYRAPIQKFTDALVGICEGISAGADALTPAARLLERVIGAISRVKPTEQAPLALPAPEDLGLSNAEPMAEIPPTEQNPK